MRPRRCCWSGSGAGSRRNRRRRPRVSARLSPEVLGELDGCLEPGTAEAVVVEALGVLARTPGPGAGAARARARRVAESRHPPGGAPGHLHGYRARAPRSCSCERWPTATRRSRSEALDLLVRRGGETVGDDTGRHAGDGGLAPVPRDPRAGPLSGAVGRGAAAGSLLPSAGPTSSSRSSPRCSGSRRRGSRSSCCSDWSRRDLDMRRAAAQGLAEGAGARAPAGAAARWRRTPTGTSATRRPAAWAGCGTPETRDLLLTLARDVESVVAATARAALEQLAGRRLQCRRDRVPPPPTSSSWPT